MSMELLRLSAIASGWARRLHEDIREYYHQEDISIKKQLIEADIKNTRDALDILEQELQKDGVIVNTGDKSELPGD